MKRLRSESGAAAVEFALVAPLLLLLLLGIVEFGRVFNAQIQVTAAAREAVRSMAIYPDDESLAKETAIASLPGFDAAQIQVIATACSERKTTVSVTYPMGLLSGLFADAVSLEGRGVMRCGG
ncbi:TadE/TadG family type IV pilus assembly protein [Arthrobacter sp. Hz1]